LSAFSTSNFLGLAFGALLASFLVTRLSMFQIAIVDSITFGMSAILCSILSISTTPSTTKQSSFRSFDTWGVIRNSNLLRSSLFHLVVLTGLIQGFHNIARTAVPVLHFDTGKVGIQNTQLAFTIGVTLGAILVLRSAVVKKHFYFNPSVYLVVACFFAVFALKMPTFEMAMIFYFLFALTFEISFTKLQNNIVLNTNKNQVGNIFSFFQMVASLALVMFILLFGKITDTYSIWASSIVLLSMAFIATCFLKWDIECDT
jgi:predicted MFS family arabinose efflux permease